MDIFEHRRRRFDLLIKRYFNNNQRKFSEDTKIKAPQVNRWLSTTAAETRRITETSARNIERASGKVPEKWLDMADDECAVPVAANEPPPIAAYPTFPAKPSARSAAIMQIMAEIEKMDDVGVGMLLERARAITDEKKRPVKNSVA